MEKLQTARTNICFCPLLGVLDVVAKVWALLIMAIPGNEGEKGFNELKRELGRTGPKPLSDTLKRREQIGVLSRSVVATSPASVNHSLTQGRSGAAENS